MSLIKPTPLHSILARHTTRRTPEGSPVHKYFTKKQWDLMGIANLGDGNYAEKQGWIRVVGDRLDVPPEAVKPFEAAPTYKAPPPPEESNADSPIDKLRDGLGNTLPIKTLLNVLKSNRTGIVDWLEEKEQSSSGMERLPKKDLVKLLNEYFNR